MLSDPHQPVSFFTEIRGMSGRKVAHRWHYGDQLVFETSFPIRGDLWRVWTTQLLPNNMPGKWAFEAVDENGDVLATQGLTYRPGEVDNALQEKPASNKLYDSIDRVWNALTQ